MKIDVLSKIIAQIVHEEIEARAKPEPVEPESKSEIEALYELIAEQDKTIQSLIKQVMDLGDAVDCIDLSEAAAEAARKAHEDITVPLVAASIAESTPEPIPGPPGEPGAPGEKGDPGETPEFPLDKVKAWAETAAVEKVKRQVDEMLPDLIPDPIKGDPGEPATVDMALVADMIQAAVKTNIPAPIKGDPGVDAPPPTQGQVDAAVEKFVPQMLAHASEKLTQIDHKGVYDSGQTYFPGDEVIRRDSTFRAKCETNEAPPHDDWQCIAKSRVGRKGDPGEPGTKGDPGEKGSDGRGISDAVMTDGQLVLAMTDGSAITVEIEDKRTTEDDE